MPWTKEQRERALLSGTWRESSTKEQRERALSGIGTLGGFRFPWDEKGHTPGATWGGKTLPLPGKGFNQQMDGYSGMGFSQQMATPGMGFSQQMATPGMGGKDYPGSMTAELPYGNWQPPPMWNPYERQQPTQTEITGIGSGATWGGKTLPLPGKGFNQQMATPVLSLPGQPLPGQPLPGQPLPGEGQRDFDALAELPYGVLEQYRKLLESGIYGPEGIEAILQRSIYPAQERTQRSIQEMLSTTRAGQAQVRSSAARMLSERLGGRFASQPGLAAKLIGDQVIAPSLAREAEMSVDIQTRARDQLNALNLAIGDLMKENMQSQLMGLAGIQDIMGFLQNRVAAHWWDTSMENRFGWSPERTAEAGRSATEFMTRLMQQFDLTKMEMDAFWRDWMNEQQYMREEYGIPGMGSNFEEARRRSRFGEFLSRGLRGG